MAITKINNNSLSAVTTLPAAIATGKVLQVVVGTTSTDTTNTSATYADTNLTANITPSATSSKILAFVDQVSCFKSTNTQIGLKLFRDATELTSVAYQLDTDDTTKQHMGLSFSFLDTPSTTDERTYKTQFNNQQANGSVHVQKNGASTITLMEIAG